MLLIYILIRIPAVQNYVSSKATNYLEDKTGAEINLDKLLITFPKAVLLKGLYVSDNQNDTLIYAGKIKVNIALWGLLRNNVHIGNFTLENTTIKLHRTLPDSNFNFQYILDSLSGGSKQQQPDTAQSGGMDFSLGTVDLNQIKFDYEDEVSGMQVKSKVGTFDLNMGTTDLEKMKFEIDDLDLSDSYAHIVITKSTTSEEDTSGSMPDIMLDEINLENIKVTFDNQPSQSYMAVNLGEFDLSAEETSLAEQKIILNSINLQQSSFTYNFHSPPSENSQEETESTDESSTPWLVKVSELNIGGLDFTFNNKALPKQEQGIDYQHLDINNLQFEATELAYEGMNISAGINELSFSEQSGFRLKQLQTNIDFTDTKASLKDLYLETNNTLIKDQLIVTYPSLESIGDKLSELYLNIRLNNTHIGYQDIEYFAPGILKDMPLKQNNLKPVYMDADLEGKLADLNINRLIIDLQENTRLNIEGKIKGLPETENLYADLSINEIKTTKSDLDTLLADSLLPQGIEIPENIRLHGSMEGSMADFHANVDLNTSLANIMADLNMETLQNDVRSYTGTIRTDTVQLGILMKDTAMFGPVKMNAEITGKGFKPENMDARADIDIPFMELNNYTYNNIAFEATAENQTYTAKGSIDDEFIEFALDGKYVQDTIKPQIEMDLNLKAANLQKLNFAKEDIRVRGKLLADLEGNNIDNVTGNIKTKNVLVIKNGKPYQIDSLIFVALNDTSKTELEIESSIIDATFKGNMKISDLGASIKDHFNNYFFIGNDSTANRVKKQNFEFNINIKNSLLLEEVIAPQITELETGTIKGMFDGKTEELKVNVEIPRFAYGGNKVTDLNVNLKSDPQKFNTTLSIGRIEVIGLEIDSLKLTSDARQDSLYNELTVKGEDEKLKYQITASLTHTDSAYRLSFLGDDMILNYNNWSVPNDNYILLGDFSPDFGNLTFSHNDESVNLQMDDNTFIIELNKFRLSNLTSLLETRTGKPIVNGIANGKLRFKEQDEGSLFNAGLVIDSTKIMGALLGKMDVDVSQENTDFITAAIDISGNNKIQINLDKLPSDPNEEVELSVDFDMLNLKTFAPILGEQVDSLSGRIQGNFGMKSKLSDPELYGKLHFRDAEAVIIPLGNRLRIPRDQIEIRNNDLTFDSFTILDRNDNELNIDGTIKTDSLKTFTLDLNLSADHFTAIDKQKADDNVFFGRLTFSTDTDITGNVSEPEITSNTTIEGDTDFKVSIQKSTPSTVESEGIVEFVDKDKNINEILIDEEEQKVAFKAAGVKVNANIATKEEATFQLIIDERAGDKLIIQGASDLSFSMGKAGTPNLTGRYNLTDGKYRLTLFNIIRKEFQIQDESYIMWTGQPLDARLNINAVYNVRAAPMNLLTGQSEMAGGMDRYKQKLPFIVNLIIRGDLMAPEISFNIELPADKRNVLNGTVEAKLQQLNQPGNESNLNKQVLSLLAFNQFMPQNPMDLGGGGGFSSTARSSVSKLLSKQLNMFADKYIKGVNLTFDVKSYEEYGAEGAPEGRTELGVGLSKSFLDNRLEVKVGGNVELESREYREQSSANDIAGDIVIIYKLTPDGIWRAKAFRLTDYEQFEGQIIESGASIIFTRSFNYLGNIFRSPEEVKQQNQDKK